MLQSLFLSLGLWYGFLGLHAVVFVLSFLRLGGVVWEFVCGVLLVDLRGCVLCWALGL